MSLMTTNHFVKMLITNDPKGDRVIVFDVEPDSGGMYNGEILTMDMCLKNASQTSEGDKDILLIEIALN